MPGPDSLAPLPLDLASTYPAYFDALVAGDWRQCRAIFERWLDAEVSPGVLYLPSLDALEQWMAAGGPS